MRLLCICHEFPPDSTPTANRTGKLLARLPSEWVVDVLTVPRTIQANGRFNIRTAAEDEPNSVVKWFRKIRLEKFADALVFPDDRFPWINPAFSEAMRMIQSKRPDVIVAFMMPYSSGIIGTMLKEATGIPLILNFDDSPTCIDMHPSYPSYCHYRKTVRFEDLLIRTADAVICVSQLNMERVRSRLPIEHQRKFNLIRYGGDLQDFNQEIDQMPKAETFTIVYIGGMNGWHHFSGRPGEISLLKRLFRAFNNLGRFALAEVDFSTSSPVYIGRAVQEAIKQNPKMSGRIKVNVYGNRYPQDLVDGVLKGQNLSEIVNVFGPIPNHEAIRVARSADLLFMTLPDRRGTQDGGRISAKTYEYLMTDRPILAALPRGENRSFIVGFPGVSVVDPRDVEGMTKVISPLAEKALAGQRIAINRSTATRGFEYDQLGKQLEQLIISTVANRQSTIAP
jgi:hypothetical protein